MSFFLGMITGAVLMAVPYMGLTIIYIGTRKK